MQLIQVGVIHSPFKFSNVPYQGRITKEICEIEIFEEYADGLKDLETFSHIYLIFWLHKARKNRPVIHPTRWGSEPRGVFATRSPFHPNPIGLTIVELIGINKNILKIRGCDAIDGTPLIDIKPYVPNFDSIKNASSGWLEKKVK